jgi:arginine utilization protein RocB
MVSKENIRRNLKDLVSVPSISGTKLENLGALKLYEILQGLNYFKEHQKNLTLVPVEDDFLKRNVVMAFVEAVPKTRDTIIITGHYDVVGTEEYGHLGDIAFDVDKITARISELDIDRESLADFNSGNWLFGRGTGDMKYGDALCIEVLRYFTEEEKISANILFLGVPAEETNSEGMLQAVKILHKFQEDGLNFIVLLNTEAYFLDNGEKENVRYIHVGSSGKIMPLFLCCGIGTHAGELTFNGFDSNLMAAKLHELLHHNVDFCETDRGKSTPPPACLKMMDLKDNYNITTPIYTASYYNIITLNLNVNKLIGKLKGVAEQAFESAVHIEKERAEQYSNMTNETVHIIAPTPKIIMFKDLYAWVKDSYSGDFDKHVDDFTKKLIEEGEEIQNVSVRLFKEVADNYPDKSPMIVIGFIPPYYPDNYPDGGDPKTKKLLETIAYMKEYAMERFGENLQTKDFYMGLSDMCYTGLNREFNYAELFENIAGLGDYYKFPEKELRGLNIPSIVFGPFSKDSHKCTERIDISYNFDVLPSLFIKFMKKISQ